jgi:hypothetical protein
MSIVTFNTDDIFTTDSGEYEILEDAVKMVKGVPGAILEIGSRRGGSAKIIIDSLISNQDTNRVMFCVDPYGNIAYSEDNTLYLDYTNNMRNEIIPSLYYYAFQSGINFTFFCLEDSEFQKRFSDGVPVYENGKTLLDKYALVFFDGPHWATAVVDETVFFVDRVNTGSVFVFDDIGSYDHDGVVEPILFEKGFELITKKTIKASYIKK